MNVNGPIRSDQLQHHPPLHPELPATTTGHSHSTPRFWTVSRTYEPEVLAWWNDEVDLGLGEVEEASCKIRAMLNIGVIAPTRKTRMNTKA
jgi:hypothetical protein